MTDIEKRIDEIMEISRKNKLHHACAPEDVLSITELRNGVDSAAEIIKHLQAQVVERNRLLVEIKGELGILPFDKTSRLVDVIGLLKKIDALINKAGE